MTYKLRISGIHFADLHAALYPGDQLEAEAIALCGRLEMPDCMCLLVQKIIPVPMDAYRCREPDYLEWDTSWMIELINEAESKNLSMVKIHSHPGGGDFFSERDDLTDGEILREWLVWYDTKTLHGSAVMLPTGKIFGRVFDESKGFVALSSVAVAGDQIQYWASESLEITHEADLRNLQTFGSGTTAALKQLNIGVVGCSGTGSVVVEQLVRLGVGRLVLIDPDIVEHKNLNRILNAIEQDADEGRRKVDVLADRIAKIGFGTEVRRLPKNLVAAQSIKEIASCDIVFGCVDGAEGRHILNRIATYYLIPYFDVGIDLQADGAGNILQISGAVHYLQPGGSSLLSRGMYTLAEVEAEAMRRNDPELYEQHRKQNYIQGAKEDSPAVLPVNMHYSSLLVLEFLARLHRYRITDDRDLAIQQFNLEDIDNVFRSCDGEPCPALANKVGRGDCLPLLDIVGLE